MRHFGDVGSAEGEYIEGAIAAPFPFTPTCMQLSQRHPSGGFTLLEVLIVCALISIAAGIAVPRIRWFADALAVDAAAREVTSLFAFGRLVALRDRGAEIAIDSMSLRLTSHGRLVRDRRLSADHGVRVRTTVSLVRYAATGIGLGLSNGTLYITRGAAADTIVISRLGRVRR